jgi:hypothetical protein
MISVFSGSEFVDNIDCVLLAKHSGTYRALRDECASENELHIDARAVSRTALTSVLNWINQRKVPPLDDDDYGRDEMLSVVCGTISSKAFHSAEFAIIDDYALDQRLVGWHNLEARAMRDDDPTRRLFDRDVLAYARFAPISAFFDAAEFMDCPGYANFLYENLAMCARDDARFAHIAVSPVGVSSIFARRARRVGEFVWYYAAICPEGDASALFGPAFSGRIVIPDECCNLPFTFDRDACFSMRAQLSVEGDIPRALENWSLRELLRTLVS